MATSSKKIQLSYPTISVSAPIFVKEDKTSMFSSADHYEVKIGNNRLEFPTKKEADAIYNETKNFKNEKQSLEFFQSYLLRRIPQRAYIIRTPYTNTMDDYNKVTVDRLFSVESLFSLKRGTYLKLQHRNFGAKRITEFVFDSTINDRALGWIKLGDEWKYGDWLYIYDGVFCTASGAEKLEVKSIMPPPNKFELPNVNETPNLSKKTLDGLVDIWNFIHSREKKSDRLLDSSKKQEDIKPYLSKVTIAGVPSKVQALIIVDAEINRRKKSITKEQVEKTIQNIWNDYYSGKDTFAYGGAMAKNYDYGGDFESPRIYIVNLEDYNNNIDGGVWLDFSDYENADELMNDIQNWLDEWGVEEYQIIDGEYLPTPMGMDVSDLRKANFVEIYTLMDVAKEKGISIDDAYEEMYGENESFADGGYFDGAIPKVSTYMTNYAKGGTLNWQKYPTKKVRGLYEIKGDGINRKVNIVFFERYDDELYSLYPLDKDKHLFREILVKSTALNSLDKGVSVKGETNDGKKVSIKRLSNQDFSYAKGGNLIRSLVSGTSGRWVADLPHAKYKIIKEVTNAQANGKNNVTYTNIVLPKGSIVHNLSGGVFVENEKLKEKYSEIYKEKYGLRITSKEETLTEINNNSEILEYAKGGSLIGNQKRIDLNKNGKIDAEDFKLLRTTMNGAWRNDHQHVNSTSRKDGKLQDYEVIYARKNKSDRTGYKGKTNYASGGLLKPHQRYVLEMKGLTGLSEQAIENYISGNKLSDNDVLNIVIGLGRKQLKGSEVARAVVGKKDNVSSKKVIAFAKDNKGMKLYDGGGFQFGVYANGGGVDRFSEYSNDALNDMIINLSRYENTESDIQMVKDELKKRKRKNLSVGIEKDSMFLTKEQIKMWNDYVKSGKINGKSEKNINAVARHIGTSVAKINAYQIEQRRNGRKFANGGGINKDIEINDSKFERFKNDLIKYSESYKYGDGYNSRFKGLKNKSGDISTGEYLIDGNVILWNYLDKKNNIYTSSEVPEMIIDIRKTGFHLKDRAYSTGGGVSKFKMLSDKVARNYEGKRVKPAYQKEYGKVYSKEEAKEVGDKVAGKVKANQKMASGGNLGKIYVVQYEVNGNKKTSEYLLYENDKVEKMLPSNAKIISIKEKMATGGTLFKNRVKPISQKMSSGAEVKKSNKGGIMVLAKQIRKEGESWKDALKRAGQQLK